MSTSFRDSFTLSCSLSLSLSLHFYLLLATRLYLTSPAESRVRSSCLYVSRSSRFARGLISFKLDDPVFTSDLSPSLSPELFYISTFNYVFSLVFALFPTWNFLN